MNLPFNDGWKTILQDEFDKPYMLALSQFVSKERINHAIFPPRSQVFEAFKQTDFNQLKVVILGQDPYHQFGQAHGLAFSVSDGIKPPPSLKNIYKELETDIPGFQIPTHGNLTHWAKQGVLLLNTTLTVRENQPGSHQKRGWEEFTDQVIKEIANHKQGIVFLLWGRFAQQKAALIDHHKHHILTAAHPSPFSAYNGFFGSKPFSKTNDILIKEGKQPIDWHLS